MNFKFTIHRYGQTNHLELFNPLELLNLLELFNHLELFNQLEDNKIFKMNHT